MMIYLWNGYFSSYDPEKRHFAATGSREQWTSPFQQQAWGINGKLYLTAWGYNELMNPAL